MSSNNRARRPAYAPLSAYEPKRHPTAFAALYACGRPMTVADLEHWTDLCPEQIDAQLRSLAGKGLASAAQRPSIRTGIWELTDLGRRIAAGGSAAAE